MQVFPIAFSVLLCFMAGQANAVEPFTSQAQQPDSSVRLAAPASNTLPEQQVASKAAATASPAADAKKKRNIQWAYLDRLLENPASGDEMTEWEDRARVHWYDGLHKAYKMPIAGKPEALKEKEEELSNMEKRTHLMIKHLRAEHASLPQELRDAMWDVVDPHYQNMWKSHIVSVLLQQETASDQDATYYLQTEDGQGEESVSTLAYLAHYLVAHPHIRVETLQSLVDQLSDNLALSKEWMAIYLLLEERIAALEAMDRIRNDVRAQLTPIEERYTAELQAQITQGEELGQPLNEATIEAMRAGMQALIQQQRVIFAKKAAAPYDRRVHVQHLIRQCHQAQTMKGTVEEKRVKVAEVDAELQRAFRTCDEADLTALLDESFRSFWAFTPKRPGRTSEDLRERQTAVELLGNAYSAMFRKTSKALNDFTLRIAEQMVDEEGIMEMNSNPINPDSIRERLSVANLDRAKRILYKEYVDRGLEDSLNILTHRMGYDTSHRELDSFIEELADPIFLAKHQFSELDMHLKGHFTAIVQSVATAMFLQVDLEDVSNAEHGALVNEFRSNMKIVSDEMIRLLEDALNSNDQAGSLQAVHTFLLKLHKEWEERCRIYTLTVFKNEASNFRQNTLLLISEAIVLIESKLPRAEIVPTYRILAHSMLPFLFFGNVVLDPETDEDGVAVVLERELPLFCSNSPAGALYLSQRVSKISLTSNRNGKLSMSGVRRTYVLDALATHRFALKDLEWLDVPLFRELTAGMRQSLVVTDFTLMARILRVTDEEVMSRTWSVAMQHAKKLGETVVANLHIGRLDPAAKRKAYQLASSFVAYEMLDEVKQLVTALNNAPEFVQQQRRPLLNGLILLLRIVAMSPTGHVLEGELLRFQLLPYLSNDTINYYLSVLDRVRQKSAPGLLDVRRPTMNAIAAKLHFIAAELQGQQRVNSTQVASPLSAAEQIDL